MIKKYCVNILIIGLLASSGITFLNILVKPTKNDVLEVSSNSNNIDVYTSITRLKVENTKNIPVEDIILPEFTIEQEISSKGLDLIKDFEGFNQYPYFDYSQWSIGYGTYVCEVDENPYDFYPNGISPEEASEELRQSLKKHMQAVNDFAYENDIGFTQNQFDALVSFTYNVGANIWEKPPEDFRLKALLVQKDYTDEDIEEAFYRWRKAGGKENLGLAKRRLAEAELFNSYKD